MGKIDKVGKWQDPTYFVSKNALLANASPSKLIRLPAGTRAEEIASTCTISLYPH